jgi:hypothetical protein
VTAIPIADRLMVAAVVLPRRFTRFGGAEPLGESRA